MDSKLKKQIQNLMIYDRNTISINGVGLQFSSCDDTSKNPGYMSIFHFKLINFKNERDFFEKLIKIVDYLKNNKDVKEFSIEVNCNEKNLFRGKSKSYRAYIAIEI